MRKFTVIFSLFSIYLLSGCVSTKKYQAIENSLMTAETNVLTTKQIVLDLEKDTTKLGQENRRLKSQVKDLENYNTYSQSILYKQMNEKNSDLEETNKRLSSLEQELKRTKTALEKTSASNDKNSTQLTKVEKYINAQNKLIQQLRNASATAAMGFEGKNVDYEAIDGKVRIIIPETVLFPSNSTSLKKDGEVALMSIANLLHQNADFQVFIETHCDPNSKRDNWDFTSKRAANISEFLIKGGVFPNQVIPSARGATVPVAENDSSENRSKNRRVVLVLSPSFKNMYDLLKMY